MTQISLEDNHASVTPTNWKNKEKLYFVPHNGITTWHTL